MTPHGQSPHSTSICSIQVTMKKRDTHWFHIFMNSGKINTVHVHLFLAILDGILFGAISSKEMVELDIVRYLHRTNKSLLYTIHNKKNAWNITSLQELLLQPAFPRMYFTVLYKTQQGHDHMLITHTESDSDN